MCKGIKVKYVFGQANMHLKKEALHVLLNSSMNSKPYIAVFMSAIPNFRLSPNHQNPGIVVRQADTSRGGGSYYLH